jgi:hypothetical protein
MNDEEIKEVKNSYPRTLYNRDFKYFKKIYQSLMKELKINNSRIVYNFEEEKDKEYDVIKDEEGKFYYKVIDKQVLDRLEKISPFTSINDDRIPLIDLEKIKPKDAILVYPPDKMLNLFYEEVKEEDYEDYEDYIEDEEKILNITESGENKIKKLLLKLNQMKLENPKTKVSLVELKNIAIELNLPLSGSKAELKQRILKKKRELSEQ